MRKVLVTGGAGFIGSSIVRRLLNSGDIVHVLDDLSTGPFENLPKHANLFFHHGSVMNKDLIKSLAKNHFDLIFHLASIVGMRLAAKYHKLTYEICTIGTTNVLDTLKNVPVVLFSSSAVFGMNNKHPVNETQPVYYNQLLQYDANDPGYACGKWALEQIGKNYAQTGRKVIILRPFNVIGERQTGAYGMVVPTFVNNAINGKPLTIFDDGFQVRSFSDIKTFVDCIFRLMQHEEIWSTGKNIINIGSKKGHTINELACMVLEETQSDSAIEYCSYEKFFPNHKDVVHRIPDTTYGEKYYGPVEWPSLRSIVKNIIQTKTATLAI